MTPTERANHWAELFLKVRGGSEEALGQLLNAFRPYLLLIANEELDSGLHPKTGASDLVQQTFLHAHEAQSQFRGESHQEMLAWLRQILLNNLANFRRSYQYTEKREVAREVPLSGVVKGHYPGEIPADTRAPDAEVLKTEDKLRLERALESLPADERELLVWRNLELCPFAEIARRLNITEKAAQKRWARAVVALQKLLTPTP